MLGLTLTDNTKKTKRNTWWKVKVIYWFGQDDDSIGHLIQPFPPSYLCLWLINYLQFQHENEMIEIQSSCMSKTAKNALITEIKHETILAPTTLFGWLNHCLFTLVNQVCLLQKKVHYIILCQICGPLRKRSLILICPFRCLFQLSLVLGSMFLDAIGLVEYKDEISLFIEIWSNVKASLLLVL